MARYQVEYANASVKDTFVFLLLVKSHKYGVPRSPPEDGESIIVDTETRAVTFHRSEQRDAIKVSPTDSKLIDAVVRSVDLNTSAQAGMAILKADALLSAGDTDLVGQLKAMVAKQAELEGQFGRKSTYRKEECADAEHIQRDYVFDGRKIKIKMNTCMACARAAADGDTEALAMFMANPISVRAFIKDFVDMHDARKATKQ